MKLNEILNLFEANDKMTAKQYLKTLDKLPIEYIGSNMSRVSAATNTDGKAAFKSLLNGTLASTEKLLFVLDDTSAVYRGEWNASMSDNALFTCRAISCKVVKSEINNELMVLIGKFWIAKDNSVSSANRNIKMNASLLNLNKYNPLKIYTTSASIADILGDHESLAMSVEQFKNTFKSAKILTTFEIKSTAAGADFKLISSLADKSLKDLLKNNKQKNKNSNTKQLLEQLSELLENESIKRMTSSKGFDHGAWISSSFAYATGHEDNFNEDEVNKFLTNVIADPNSYRTIYPYTGGAAINHFDEQVIVKFDDTKPVSGLDDMNYHWFEDDELDQAKKDIDKAFGFKISNTGGFKHMLTVNDDIVFGGHVFKTSKGYAIFSIEND